MKFFQSKSETETTNKKFRWLKDKFDGKSPIRKVILYSTLKEKNLLIYLDNEHKDQTLFEMFYYTDTKTFTFNPYWVNNGKQESIFP